MYCRCFSKLTGETHSQEPSWTSVFPGNGLCCGTPPDPLTPLIPLPSLKAPLPTLLPLGFCRDQSSSVSCTLTVQEHERWQKQGYRLCVTPQCSSGWYGRHRGCTAQFPGRYSTSIHDTPTLGSSSVCTPAAQGVHCVSRAWVFG